MQDDQFSRPGPNETDDPVENIILARMSAADRQALGPHLRPLTMTRGQVLIPQGRMATLVHFPTSAVLANAVSLADGSLIETALVGREGVSGLAAFMAEEPVTWEVSVKLPGRGWEISAELLRRQVEVSDTLFTLLLRATHHAQSQAAQNAACVAGHSITQRLAKSLLELWDRTQGNEIGLTQQEMASTLGAERTTINAALGQLKGMKAIAQHRGRVQLLNRTALEHAACECYRVEAAQQVR